MFHTVAWLLWLVASATIPLITQHPLYLALTLTGVWLVYQTVRRCSPEAAVWGSLVKLALFVWLFTVPFNALAVHVGQMVLFRLPTDWPIVGGAITLEAIVYGLLNGLKLITLLLVFAVFNTGVDHYRLLRLTPAFLYQVGVITSIAVTFVPQMIAAGQEIREAQTIRGHRFRGLRDLLPLFVPLLTGGLERAMGLAESMESRGFGGNVRAVSSQEELLIKLGTLLALLLALGGVFWYGYFAPNRTPGAALMGIGAVLLIAIFWRLSRRVARTRYRRGVWRWRDTALALSSLALGAGLLATRLAGGNLLSYSPYPPHPLLPSFNTVVGLLMLLVAAPALLWEPQKSAP
ncbi:MAG: energy-coupling factor transporter transmembrane component T [Chloroflexota bacterium]